MPLRTYRCPEGHLFEVYESMDGPRATECPHHIDGVRCGGELEPLVSRTQRPIVKGGTKIHHGWPE